MAGMHIMHTTVANMILALTRVHGSRMQLCMSRRLQGSGFSQVVVLVLITGRNKYCTVHSPPISRNNNNQQHDLNLDEGRKICLGKQK
jgi:hypothetical protein